MLAQFTQIRPVHPNWIITTCHYLHYAVSFVALPKRDHARTALHQPKVSILIAVQYLTVYPYLTLEQAAAKGLPVCIPPYIPAGMEALESRALLKDDTVERAFFAYVGPGKNFLMGAQDRRQADSTPLDGREIDINGKTAFVRALDTARDLPQYPSLKVEGTAIAWDEGDFRVQVLSTLPEEQVLLVAQSMSPCGS